jgi:hypothetical protein
VPANRQSSARRRAPSIAAGAVLLVAISMIAAGCSGSADEPVTLDQASADEVGTRLVTEYYDTLDCEGKDVDAYAGLLDSSFQSVTATGPKTKDQVLTLMGSTCFENPVVSDITVTAAPGVLVVSYRASISRDGVAQAPTQRVNVFVDEGGTWKGVTYADAGLPGG